MDSYNDAINLTVIGSSTGGPDTLRVVLRDIRLRSTIVVVQHMPRFINQSVRHSLEKVSGMNAVIPEDGEYIVPGTLYIAPSDYHLQLFSNRIFNLVSSPPVNYVRPSADVTMKSITPARKATFISVVLTGMGADGAQGSVHMKNIGALTIAQTPETCSVAGMPERAIETCSIDLVLSPEEIRLKLIEIYGQS